MVTAIQITESVEEVVSERPQVRTLARLLFATLWLVVCTGAVRKWIFPSVGALYLLQDVPIAIAYIYALVNGLFTRSLILVGLSVLSALLILQTMIQIMFAGLPAFIAIVGIHNYLFYLPMMVVFPVVLDARYRGEFVRWNLLMALPMCFIGVWQSISPSSAFINKSATGEGMTIPEGGITRGTGTFNFTSFYALWLGIAFALCIGEWLQPLEKRKIQNKFLLVCCTMAFLLATLASAERTAIGLELVVLVGGAIAAALIGSSRPLLLFSSILVLIPIAVGVVALISPAEFTAIVTRTTDSDHVSDSKQRIADLAVGFLQVDFDPMGAGLGVGVDAAHFGDDIGNLATYALSEDDLTRNVMELGTFTGLIYAFTRVGFFLGLIFLAASLVKKGNSPHVLPLALVLFSQAYFMDMTRNGTMTTTQLMLGCSFILGVFYYPDSVAPVVPAGGDEMMMRSV